MSNTNSNVGKLIKRIIVLVMASFTFLMLAFKLCKVGYNDSYLYNYGRVYYDSGFSIMSFNSTIIAKGYDYEWAIYLLGLTSISLFLVSFVVIAGAIFNLIFRNKMNLDVLFIIVSMVLTGFYMIMGIIYFIIAKIEYSSDYYNVGTAAFWPFLLEIFLLIGYIVIANVFKAENTTTPQQSSSYLVKSSQSYQSASKPIAQPAKPAAAPKKELSTENLNLLKQLADLKEQNIISEEEFNTKKKELLGL